MVSNSRQDDIRIGRMKSTAEEQDRGEGPVMVLPGAPTVDGAPHASVVAIDQAVADPRQSMVIGVGG